jgi:fermentation-respiration switch protein FrsA (DUF1100 family)
VSGRIRDAGLAALSIDFSHNGTFPELPPVDVGPAGGDANAPTVKHQPKTTYPRPDLFRINTLTRERVDLAAVMRFIRNRKLDAYLECTPTSMGLFGHSRGGVVAFLHAAETGNANATDRVDALCTWSIPQHANIFDARQLEKWRQQGAYNFTDADGTRLSVDVQYLEDLENYGDLYDLRKQSPQLRTPHLVVHGETDLAVNVEHARVLYGAETNVDDKRLLIVQTGHLFGVPYPPRDPFDPIEPRSNPKEPADALVEATDATVEWFSRYLGKGA